MATLRFRRQGGKASCMPSSASQRPDRPARPAHRPARRAPIPAYSAILSHAGRRALLEAIERLTDDALDAVVKMMSDGRPFAETRIAGYFPFPQFPRYTPFVVRQLV